MEFCDGFSRHFVAQGMNSVTHARHYLSGLLGKQRRKNIETIENDIPDSDYQGMEQFISASPWSHEEVMEQVGREADKAFGDPAEAGLYFDESSFLKKGKASVGVQRQWSGRAGKVENCQVGVFACLAKGGRFAVTDFRLYLPEEWADDPLRCEAARIPVEHRGYLPKWRQALEMVRDARKRGQRFGYVGFDSLYGSNAQLVNALEDDGEYFMGDVDKSVQVWMREPAIESPGKSTGQGRPLKHFRIAAGNTAEKFTVEKLVANLDEEDFLEIEFRQGEKGRLCGRFWMGEVWHWRKGEPKARKRSLLVRKDADGSLKYSLTNLPGGKPLSYYANIQGQRFWIEHAFHEAKSQLGMAQYQVRVWKGWHHHMALVCMALLFTELYKAKVAEEVPLLTARDITELLAFYLPRRDRCEAEVHKRIHKRHEQRKADRERRRNRKVGVP